LLTSCVSDIREQFSEGQKLLRGWCVANEQFRQELLEQMTALAQSRFAGPESRQRCATQLVCRQSAVACWFRGGTCVHFVFLNPNRNLNPNLRFWLLWSVP
jgi:hypothetical protein